MLEVFLHVVRGVVGLATRLLEGPFVRMRTTGASGSEDNDGDQSAKLGVFHVFSLRQSTRLRP